LESEAFVFELPLMRKRYRQLVAYFTNKKDYRILNSEQFKVIGPKWGNRNKAEPATSIPSAPPASRGFSQPSICVSSLLTSNQNPFSC